MQLDIHHVCFIVKDIGRSEEKFRALYGTGPFKHIESDHPEGIVRGKNVHYKGKIAFAEAGQVELELVEPTEGASIWQEFLDTRGEGMHHIAVFVPDLDKELAGYKEKGIGVLMRGETDLVRLAYMDTEPHIGIIVEILQKK